MPNSDMPNSDELDLLTRAFEHHPPTEGKIVQHQAVRTDALRLVTTIVLACPPSPERAQAVNRAREAMMWANAAIALHEPHAEAVDLADIYESLKGGPADRFQRPTVHE